VVHGINRNAPVNGVRPDAAFANVIAVASEGESRFDQLTTTLNLNLAPARRPAVPPLWDWRRLNARLTHWLAKITNNSDGAFSVSPTGTLATEWAPSREDRRHRMAASVNTQLLRDLNATLSLNGGTGAPYSMTTGFDDNGDSIFNDRPLGVGRNTLRTPSQWTWNANASYSLRMGVRTEPSPQERGADGAKRVATQANSRYRLTFNVSVNNLTNHANYTGFSGVMTSPFFLQPTAVSNPRKVDMSVSFGF